MRQARIVRKGEGEVYERLWKFKEGSLTGGRYDFMVGDVTYLSGPPLHVHKDQDDTFFVLDGVLTVQVGDDVFELRPGDFATVPPGIPHTFDNVKKDQPPVKVVNLMTPGGLDAQFRDFTTLGPGKPDPNKMEALRRKHGVKSVGPTLGVKLGLV
jgi:quercetin dioxygenase-like cupin family protein